MYTALYRSVYVAYEPNYADRMCGRNNNQPNI